MGITPLYYKILRIKPNYTSFDFRIFFPLEKPSLLPIALSGISFPDISAYWSFPQKHSYRDEYILTLTFVQEAVTRISNIKVPEGLTTTRDFA
jgi:hypothetical protein